MLIIGKSILLIINNTRSIQNPKLLSFILIIHHVLKRTCFLINSQKYDFYTAYANSFDYDDLKQVLDNFGISQQQDWYPAITETKIRYRIAKSLKKRRN